MASPSRDIGDSPLHLPSLALTSTVRPPGTGHIVLLGQPHVLSLKPNRDRSQQDRFHSDLSSSDFKLSQRLAGFLTRVFQLHYNPIALTSQNRSSLAVENSEQVRPSLWSPGSVFCVLPPPQHGAVSLSPAS